MDVNKDITLRKAKRQEASSNSTNLADNLKECAKGTEEINEGALYNLIPIRRWMREHYTKLTRNNRARCNHCNEKFSIHITSLNTLHKHLVNIHPDKLAEEQKKEIKFHWIWDYYITKSDRQAMCNRCKVTVTFSSTTNLIKHLKRIHNMSGPTTDIVIHNESSSDDDTDAIKDITLRKAKHQEASSNSTNLSDNLYECAEETEEMNEGALYNLIPMRRWMREHYTKLTRNNRAKCNHCNEKFSIHLSHLHILHKHLVNIHPRKLAEEQKKEIKFHWIWDYYIAKSDRQATCNRCKTTIMFHQLRELKKHLKHHEISGPTSNNVIANGSSSDHDMDVIKDITLKKAKCQASSNSTNLSDNLYKCAEGTQAINEISGPHTTSDNIITNGNSSDHDMDAIKDITLRKAKCQEALSNSTNLSDNLQKYKCAEGTEAINEIFGPGSDNDMDNENNSYNYVDADTTIKSAKRQEDLSNSTEFLKKANSVPISSSTGMETPNVSASVYRSTSTAKSNIDSSDKVNEYVYNNICTDNFEQNICNNISTDNSEEVDDVSRACNENVLFLEDNVRVEDNTGFESQFTIGGIEQEMVFWPLLPVYILWPLP